MEPLKDERIKINKDNFALFLDMLSSFGGATNNVYLVNSAQDIKDQFYEKADEDSDERDLFAEFEKYSEGKIKFE